jgi:electron transfer flavoprotein beta subunit
LRPEVDPLTADVVADPKRVDLSAPDEAALEYALRAAENWGGRVVAVAAGPSHVDPALRQAVAAGAAALRVSDGHDEETPATRRPWDGASLAGDPDGVASRLASAITRLGQPALVLCGDRSVLRGTGAVPALLADRLRASQALGLVSLRFEAESLIAERRLDGGRRERLRLTAPAVCSVEATGVRLRRASLAAALAAAGSTIPVTVLPTGVGRGPSSPAGTVPTALRAAAPQSYRPRTHPVAPPAGDAHQRLLALSGARLGHDPPRIIGPTDADGAVEELLRYLRRHGYLRA